MRKPVLLSLLVALAVLLGAFPARGQDKAPHNPPAKANFMNLSVEEQTSYLNALLQRWRKVKGVGNGKSHALVSAELLVSSEREVNGRTVCSGSGHGSATPSSGQPAAYNIDTYSDAVCRQLHDVQSGIVLATADSKQSFGAKGNWRSGHLIFLACTSGYSKRQKIALGAFGYGASLFMHKHPCAVPEGPIVRVVLAREKHGEWSVYIGTHKRLGGKGKVSKYALIQVEKFVINQTIGKQ